ncbi:4-aminobutyrate--2-oxoglutarate transaminase [Cardiobacteriaceae bacterium TAE3-ERU3]|nr:4-aminobutyrate--2-oxoglutarate transaminase [Cardiobacteriaceae bacterium TAE3-ERU3]
MTTNQALQQRKEAAVPRGLGIAFPFYAEKAKNAELWDVEGNRYIDFIGGISVLNTGHSHPKITAAVHAQIDKFSHTAAQIACYEIYVELAERLNAAAPGSTPKKTVFFNSGAEAVENAVKIARAYTGRHGVIAFDGGYHGRTVFTLALTGKMTPYKQKFGPMPGGIFRIPYPAEVLGVSEEESLKALKMRFKTDIDPSQVAAIIFEPVQGEGGFHAMSPEFAQKLRKICDEHGIMLICDEVQSGFGRTGTLYATEQLGIEPDLLTTAKSLAGGYPLSGVIGKAEVMDAPDPGGLGGTYTGSPIAVAAALAVMDVFEEENLLERSKQIGERIAAFLQEQKESGISIIGDIRYKGAMLAFDIINADGEADADKTKALIAHAKDNGLMLASCGMYGNTIRIMVPLTVENEILEEGLEIIAKALNA